MAEESIALQAHALDLAAMGREDGKLLGSAIKSELDRIHAARTYRESGAADGHSDEHAGNEAELDDEQRDGEQRGVFEQRDPPRGIDQPLIHQARAEIEKQASEDEFGDVGDEARIDREHQDRSSSDGEPAN